MTTTKKAPLAPFVFTHGKTEQKTRDGDLFKSVTTSKALKVAPAKGGRKVSALFEAQNPNGVFAKLASAKFDLPAEGPVAEAYAYVNRFGGKKCVKSWPSAPRLKAALETLYSALEAASKKAA